MIRTLTIAALLMLAVACGGDAIPTATSIPPTPAPFVPPPTQTSVADVSAGVAELLGFESIRDFPEELKSDSPPLDREVAAEIASAFMSDVRLANGPVIIDFCSDGSGRMINGLEADFANQPFQWEVQANPAARWNQPRILFTFDDHALASFIEAQGALISISPPVDGELRFGGAFAGGAKTVVFDNPTCGQ